ncbi:MAG: DUF3859 domain-containing protein [Planctomycetales bacterium]|nr:DUF3859 domain-containing protein [Planctomycetales bacterium]
MVKRKPEVRIRSYGIYEKWNRDTKELPRFVQATYRVRAEVDVEFGFVVNIKGAKNCELEYCIFHPGILDENGTLRPPFDGSVYVKHNDWDFYLGDTIWEPIADKLGDWRMTLTLSGKIVADKTFTLYQ